MSNRVESRQRGGSTDWHQMTKPERRAAAKAAAAQAAAAKRRLQMIKRVLAGLIVAGVVIGVYFYVVGGSGDPATNASSQASGAASTAAATQAATKPAFPPLPEGADPALGTKPAASAGTGDLTQLSVTTLIEGKGAVAKAGQQITVNYVGVSYQTGVEFDASWKRSEPFSFVLGGGNVIAGWDQGLIGAKVGSRVQLDLPASLAYGDNPSGGQPAGPLRFIVDVLAVR